MSKEFGMSLRQVNSTKVQVHSLHQGVTHLTDEEFAACMNVVDLM